MSSSILLFSIFCSYASNYFFLQSPPNSTISSTAADPKTNPIFKRSLTTFFPGLSMRIVCVTLPPDEIVVAEGGL
ncbi:hypothetical protein BC830DRAFT_1120576, partial [Chytriomyces sp. MP71]